MYRKTAILLLMLLPAVGCAGFMDFRHAQLDRRKARRLVERQEHMSNIDGLWKSGYGFYNPNPDRIRQGLDPVNFDGKTDQERRKSESVIGRYLGNLMGDAILYGGKVTLETTGRLIRETF